ncbi:hypothetical protein [Sphingobium lactosutens]|uniref:hypothetical protein n=1 Tax=Sphingobium lactosutens TaxID=522773 RepID=UPI001268BE02|nr:hypothetical protein [Sphingobium lactosutens]
MERGNQGAIIDPVIDRHYVPDPSCASPEIGEQIFQRFKQFQVGHEVLPLLMRGEHPHIGVVCAARVVAPKEKFAVFKGRRLANGNAPAALACGLGQSHVRESELPNCRKHAVCADYKIVTHALAIVQRYVNAIIALLDRRNCDAELDRQGKLRDPALHDPVKGRPHDAAIGWQPFQP